MKWIDKRLNVLKLSKTEERVLDVLDIPRTVQDIAKLSGVSRTGVNHVITHLIEDGLVSYEMRGKRRLYFAISHTQLAERLKKTLDQIEIENTQKKGARVKVSQEDEFVIHVGVHEIIPAYARIASMNKNERIKAIQHHRSWLELTNRITREQLIDFNNNIIKNKIILDGMLNESAYQSYKKEIEKNPEKHKGNVESLKGRMADYTVFPDNFFNYDVEIWMFKSTTLIINWKEEIAIEIINTSITFFLKDMFEFVKMGGRKIDHNKIVEGILG